MIREITRSGNERSPYCEIETPSIFDDHNNDVTHDDLLVDDMLEAAKRESFADALAGIMDNAA